MQCLASLFFFFFGEIFPVRPLLVGWLVGTFESITQPASQPAIKCTPVREYASTRVRSLRIIFFLPSPSLPLPLSLSLSPSPSPPLPLPPRAPPLGEDYLFYITSPPRLAVCMGMAYDESSTYLPYLPYVHTYLPLRYSTQDTQDTQDTQAHRTL